MTDNEITCDICERHITNKPTYYDDEGVYVDALGTYETLGDFYNDCHTIALWHEGHGIYVCIDCVTHAYIAENGEPLRTRIRLWWWRNTFGRKEALRLWWHHNSKRWRK